MNVSQTLGILIVYLVGLCLDWRTLQWTMLIPHAITVIWILLQAPETPYFLLDNGLKEEALETLKKLRGPDYDVTEEFREMVKRHEVNLEKNKNADHSQMKHFLVTVCKPRFLKPFFVAGGLSVITYMTGVGTLLMFLVNIFEESGTQMDAGMASVGVTSLKFVFSLFSSIALRFVPRRMLFLSSTALLVVCMFILANEWILRPFQRKRLVLLPSTADKCS